MAGEQEEGPLHFNEAVQKALETGKPVPFIQGDTPLMVDNNLQVGYENPKEAQSSPSAIEDLSAAVNAAEELKKATISSSKESPRGNL